MTTTDMKMKNKPITDRDPRQRRNGTCDMLMPIEYFAALFRLELLNVRYQFGSESLKCFSWMKPCAGVKDELKNIHRTVTCKSVDQCR